MSSQPDLRTGNTERTTSDLIGDWAVTEPAAEMLALPVAVSPSEFLGGLDTSQLVRSISQISEGALFAISNAEKNTGTSIASLMASFPKPDFRLMPLVRESLANLESSRLLVSPVTGDSFQAIIRDAFPGDRLSLPNLLGDRWFADFSASLEERLQQAIPPNWRSPHIDPESAVEAMEKWGLPLAWVPRAQIVAAILRESDANGARRVIVERKNDILRDCDDALDRLPHEVSGYDLKLSRIAVRTCLLGSLEGGQSLATNVLETLLAHSSGHNVMRDAFGSYFSEKSIGQIRDWASFYPIQILYRSWYPGDPILEGPSRHLTTHRAISEVYTEANSILSVMCLVSVLSGLVLRPETIENVWCEQRANEVRERELAADFKRVKRGLEKERKQKEHEAWKARSS